MPLHLHLAEQLAEVADCRAALGISPVELLEREQVLGPELTAVHAIHLESHDIELLGANQVNVCACTTTERDLGDEVGPLDELARAGCPLTVGSDSNAIIDMFEEARGLELDQRRSRGRRGLHDPDALLAAATTNGMNALGWPSGELKQGMLADFITVSPPVGMPSALTSAGLIFAASARDVSNVVVGGSTVVRSRQAVRS